FAGRDPDVGLLAIELGSAVRIAVGTGRRQVSSVILRVVALARRVLGVASEFPVRDQPPLFRETCPAEGCEKEGDQPKLPTHELLLPLQGNTGAPDGDGHDSRRGKWRVQAHGTVKRSPVRQKPASQA